MICNMCPRHETCSNAKVIGCENCDIGRAFHEERKKLLLQKSLNGFYLDGLRSLDDKNTFLCNVIDEETPYRSFFLLRAYNEVNNPDALFAKTERLIKNYDRISEIFMRDKNQDIDFVNEINIAYIKELGVLSAKVNSLRNFLCSNCYLFEDLLSFEFVGVYYRCEIKDGSLYSCDGDVLSSDGGSMDECIPYFVNQSTGYLGDDYYGVMYIKVDDGNTFVAVRYAM